MLAGGAIVAIVLLVTVVVLIRRRRRAEAAAAPLPLIPFSTVRGTVGPPRPENAVTPPRNASVADPSSAPVPTWSAPASGTRSSEPSRPSFAPPPTMGPTHASTGSALVGTAQPNEPVEGSAVDGASVRYWRPADGTLQFLPGRLEVIAGRDAGQEIRFVRTPGPDGTRVTFGRAEGAPYRHVQLREPTVSRAHARMTLENGASSGAAPAQGSNGSRANGPRWRLENLSATNPVVVNGQPLAADGSTACWVALGEGDRIEMGEVVFRFHEK
jgi:hypothetical protein